MEFINITANMIKNNIVSGTYNEIDGKFLSDKAINIPFGSKVRINREFNLGNDFTLSFWCRIIQDQYSPKYPIAEFIDASDDSVYGIWYYPYQQRMYFGNNMQYYTAKGSVIYGKHHTWEYFTLRFVRGWLYYYINGQLINSTDYTVNLQKAKALCIGLQGINGEFYDDIYIYNMVIDTRPVSLDNFNPPKRYVAANKTVYINENKEVYKVPLVKIADNWDSLSNSQKEALFSDVGYEQASSNELETLGKFKIITYGKENEKVDCFVDATPKVQTVLPKDLINIKQVENINKITITQTIQQVPERKKNASLIRFDDDSFKDVFGTSWIPSTPANSTIESENAKFGSCVVFSGENGGTQFLANKDVGFGSGNFTIDFWLNAPSAQPTANPTIVADRGNTFRIAKDKFMVNNTSIGTNWLDEAFDDNWHHIAFIRDGRNFILYIDGIKKQESNNQLGTNINIASIGASTASFSNTYIKGKIDEFSAVPYVRWRENFTPPTSAYPQPAIKPPQGNFVKYAFTINKQKYYVYQNGDWQEIQTDEIATKGNSKESVESIPKEKWRELITEKETKVVSKLGIAYAISQRYTDDTVYIDNLSLLIDQRGKWRKCQPHGHYQVDYTDNETVEVTLLGAGSYKINYSLGG